MEQTAAPVIRWTENGVEHSALWRSENRSAPPARVVIADDTLKADTAYRMACEGTGLLWRGDYYNARQLLQAMSRRVERKPHKTSDQMAEAFNLHRMAQGQRARILGMILLPLNHDFSIPLRRAPDVRQACIESYGADAQGDSVVSLREVLGLIGAHEWRSKGVEIPALRGDGKYHRIHPHYGVFSPVRGEYVDLLKQVPLPQPMPQLAFDIGTGTGVLAAVLARRGIPRIIATDQDPRALASARENLSRLEVEAQVELMQTDLFPPGKAPLIVCNPPWIPARPSSSIEQAIYDPDSRMLHGFLNGLAEHLEPGGEGWLVISDIAEHLGLRSREELLQAISSAGLEVIARIDTRPQHGKVADTSDALHAARAAEITSLWRLGLRQA